VGAVVGEELAVGLDVGQPAVGLSVLDGDGDGAGVVEPDAVGVGVLDGEVVGDGVTHAGTVAVGVGDGER
jgi:hypothetical protein